MGFPIKILSIQIISSCCNYQGYQKKKKKSLMLRDFSFYCTKFGWDEFLCNRCKKFDDFYHTCNTTKNPDMQFHMLLF